MSIVWDMGFPFYKFWMKFVKFVCELAWVHSVLLDFLEIQLLMAPLFQGWHKFTFKFLYCSLVNDNSGSLL